MAGIHGEGGEVVDVTIEAVRDRFHTLNVPMAYFDGPAGTQCPDSVIEAGAGYLLAADAETGGGVPPPLGPDGADPGGRAAPPGPPAGGGDAGGVRPELAPP